MPRGTIMNDGTLDDQLLEDIPNFLQATEHNADQRSYDYRIAALKFLEGDRPDVASVYAQLAISVDLYNLPTSIYRELFSHQDSPEGIGTGAHFLPVGDLFR